MVIIVCDTMVRVDSDGVMFAKNSDRDANESQVLEWRERATHAPDESVRCTWIEIPQVPTTNAVLLSRPWWMWGAEMGANEHGVVIGNEAVFTTEPDGEASLLGMDLLRLALERASSAAEATSVIVELLERHGQGGACSYERPGFTYHNSFLIADTSSAMVLETAGQKWATEEVRTGARSISNGLTIPDFAQHFSRVVRSRVIACRVRRSITESAVRESRGVGDLMTALRDHGGAAPRWSPINGTLHAPCVHAGGLVASSQTTASMVSDLRGDPRHWATATAAPCTSIFKPVTVREPIDLGPVPSNRFDSTSLWWRHEQLHRAAIRDLGRWVPTFALERDELEARWILDPPGSRSAFDEAETLHDAWLERLGSVDEDRRPWWVARQWRRLDAAAAMPHFA